MFRQVNQYILCVQYVSRVRRAKANNTGCFRLTIKDERPTDFDFDDWKHARMTKVEQYCLFNDGLGWEVSKMRRSGDGGWHAPTDRTVEVLKTGPKPKLDLLDIVKE